MAPNGVNWAENSQSPNKKHLSKSCDLCVVLSSCWLTWGLQPSWHFFRGGVSKIFGLPDPIVFVAFEKYEAGAPKKNDCAAVGGSLVNKNDYGSQKWYLNMLLTLDIHKVRSFRFFVWTIFINDWKIRIYPTQKLSLEMVWQTPLDLKPDFFRVHEQVRRF